MADKYEFPDFPPEALATVTKNMAELGFEKTPAEWQVWLHHMCRKHLAEHPEHENLPFPELWAVVQDRINSTTDPFPNAK